MANMKAIIKSVAIDLFFKKGYFATSISEIAGGSGIQKASIYHHFPGKEDLLFCIMQTTMADLMDALKVCLDGIHDVECQMRAAVRSHVMFHLQRQKETFIASSELRGLEPAHLVTIIDYRDQYERKFQDLIATGIQEGFFAHNDVSILSYAILTLCTAGATWYKPAGRLSAEAIALIYENFILNGLKPGQPMSARPAELMCDPWPL
jgi:AcrR family transcriptional regulator